MWTDLKSWRQVTDLYDTTHFSFCGQDISLGSTKGMTDLDKSTIKAIDSERRGTTSEEVISRLREMIHRGELRPGDRLPPERDFAKMLGVSRPTLRAGIRSLAAVGVLQ